MCPVIRRKRGGNILTDRRFERGFQRYINSFCTFRETTFEGVQFFSAAMAPQVNQSRREMAYSRNKLGIST